MRGQNSIIDLRLEGLKPTMVWVIDLPVPCFRGPFMDAETAIVNGDRPEIQVGIDDELEALDFRCLVGLTVLLQGSDRARLRRLRKRIKEFQPARLVTSSTDFIHDEVFS